MLGIQEHSYFQIWLLDAGTLMQYHSSQSMSLLETQQINCLSFSFHLLCESTGPWRCRQSRFTHYIVHLMRLLSMFYHCLLARCSWILGSSILRGLFHFTVDLVVHSLKQLLFRSCGIDQLISEMKS